MLAAATAPKPARLTLKPTTKRIAVGCSVCGEAFTVPASSIDFTKPPTSHWLKPCWPAGRCPECHSETRVPASGELAEVDRPALATGLWQSLRIGRTLGIEGLAGIEDYDSSLSRRLRGTFHVPPMVVRPTNKDTMRAWRGLALFAVLRTVAREGFHAHLERQKDGRYRDAHAGCFTPRPAPHVLEPEAMIERSKKARGKDAKAAYVDDAFCAFRVWSRLAVADCLAGRWDNVNPSLPKLPVAPGTLFRGLLDRNDREAALSFYGALEVVAELEEVAHV